MASGIPGSSIRRNNYGLRVERATAALPASTAGNLFAVSGRIILTTIVGTVTTAIQAQTCTWRLEAFLTSAAAATDLSLITGTDLASAAVGRLLSITGTTTAVGVTGYGVPQTNELLINGPGFIRLVTGATNTGSVSWSLTYVPLDDGAAVTAV